MSETLKPCPHCLGAGIDPELLPRYRCVNCATLRPPSGSPCWNCGAPEAWNRRAPGSEPSDDAVTDPEQPDVLKALDQCHRWFLEYANNHFERAMAHPPGSDERARYEKRSATNYQRANFAFQAIRGSEPSDEGERGERRFDVLVVKGDIEDLWSGARDAAVVYRTDPKAPLHSSPYGVRCEMRLLHPERRETNADAS